MRGIPNRQQISNTFALRRRRRQESRLWKQASTFEELTDLNARFLAGDLVVHPGHSTDNELPICDTLVRVNRAGFLTNHANQATAGYLATGKTRPSTASVRGWVSDRRVLDILSARCTATMTEMIVDPQASNQTAGPTESRARAAKIGAQPSRTGQAGETTPGAVPFPHPDAVAAVENAFAVELIDSGLNSLQRMLSTFASDVVSPRKAMA